MPIPLSEYRENRFSLFSRCLSQRTFAKTIFGERAATANSKSANGVRRQHAFVQIAYSPA